MAASAISGDYVDLRFVKGRKVAVIHVEIPMEAADDFLAKFGAPRPAEGVPVALARLLPGKTEEAAPKAPRKFDALALPQQAALMGDREAFWAFVREKLRRPCNSAETAANVIRTECGVASRSEIRPNTVAGEEFIRLRDSFDAWMRTAA